MRQRVEQVIKEIQPMIQGDGGDIQLIDVDEKTGKVTVQLYGACVGCPLSQVTLKAGVERMLKEKIPGIKSVETIDEAASI